MWKYGNIYLFSDCGINPNPNSDELAEIAVTSANSYKQLVGQNAKVAMLSYSTYGSAKSELTKKSSWCYNTCQIKRSQINDRWRITIRCCNSSRSS